MRKSSLFMIFLAGNLLILCLIFIHASYQQTADQSLLQARKELVRKLELTDICLFTEASYTRHLSQADLHTPFQDSPMSFEHFPSGSIVAPPKSLRKINEKMD